jgi:glutathione S-transferase
MRTIFFGLVRTPHAERDQEAIDAAIERRARRSGRGSIASSPIGRSSPASRLTVGDIPVGVLYHRYHALGVARAAQANLESWYERLQARAPFRKHVMIPLA